MTNTPTTILRRLLSLSAFSVLIAAVTLSFAEAPNSRRSVRISKSDPAIRITPNAPVLLAQAPSKRGSKAAPAPAAKAPIQHENGLSGTLNLNQASAAQLMLLPGIGPKKAEKIIKWRTAHGNFRRVTDLRRVKGFGSKTVKKLRPYLSVSGQSTLH